MKRGLVFLIVIAVWLVTSLVLWLRTTFWVAFAWFVGQFVLMFVGAVFVELRDRWRARRARSD